MSESHYDLAIVGAGAAGLTAADFALQLGARVALLERDRIGGDCTWTGCVPSKSLIKVAHVAASARQAAAFGLQLNTPVVEFPRVREYLHQTIAHIYAPTAPDALRARGVAVHLGPTRFVGPHTLEVGDRRVSARRVLICTGAVPRQSVLPGLDQVAHLTYKQIFANDRGPASLLVIGGGPLGCEVAQSYQRLGVQVSLIAPRLLPRAEPQVSELLSQALAADGVRHVRSRARAVRGETGRVVVRTDEGEIFAAQLLVAVGRVPNIGALGLERAGVRYSARGIEVNARLQTTARHIYAAGDCLGGAQFSHLAGWQAFHAVRNALLPGSSAAVPDTIPEVTFTVPEVAHVGLSEEGARQRFGEAVRTAALDLRQVDRAVSEADARGLVKLIAHRNGRILGATVMGERAGEVLAEVSLAMANGLKLRHIAASIHPYPTYNSALQLLATQLAVRESFSGWRGQLIRTLSRWSLRSG